MNEKTKTNILKAGKIASQVREEARKFIKKDMPLLEIAEKIEEKIISLGAIPAFPVNLSINEIAAHYTPSYNDETTASGLLKVDLGVSINGSIADTAFSIDLEEDKTKSEENKKLIKASEEALNESIKLIKNNKDATLSEIGNEIEKTINSHGFIPIINLSGHEIEEYDLHAGITIPNIDNGSDKTLPDGLYAIEPFATSSSGSGKIRDARDSGIYNIAQEKNTRSPLAREVLDFIIDNYQTLPFCSRWLVKEFGTRALVALSQLEREGILHQFTQLVESSGKPVSQAEHTILIEKGNVIITTE